jgi:hypothetical protein
MQVSAEFTPPIGGYTMQQATQPAQVTPTRIGWDAHCLRVLEFLEERLAYGQTFGYMMNSQNGQIGINHQPSTKADIEKWGVQHSYNLHLIATKQNAQGMWLWVWSSQRHAKPNTAVFENDPAYHTPYCSKMECEHWQMVPEGVQIA